MDSILTSIKKLLGVDEVCDHFDVDVMIHINSAFTILKQLGVGPPQGFMITGTSEVWSDFLPEGIQLESVKTYIYLKVKLVFDPPTSSSVLEAMKQQIQEYEWRQMVDCDPIETG